MPSRGVFPNFGNADFGSVNTSPNCGCELVARESGSVAGSARTLVDPVQCNVFFFHRPSTLSKKTDHAGEHLMLTCEGTRERDIIADRTTATPTRLRLELSTEGRLEMLEEYVGRGYGLGGKKLFDSDWRRFAQFGKFGTGLEALNRLARRVLDQPLSMETYLQS